MRHLLIIGIFVIVIVLVSPGIAENKNSIDNMSVNKTIDIHPMYAEKDITNGSAQISNSSPHDDSMKKPHYKDERHGFKNRGTADKNFYDNATSFQDSGILKNFRNQTPFGICSVNENRSVKDKIKNNITNSTNNSL